uniref:Uncharacterized protein n=1 Tax=Strongyloides stercoralis TaxID=6248 RepID=A0A0K0ELE1_STRER
MWVSELDHINFLSPERKITKSPETLTTEANIHNDYQENNNNDINSELHVDFSDSLKKVDLIKLMEREDIYPRSIKRLNRARKRNMSSRKSNDFEIPCLFKLKSQQEADDY